jgi:mannose-6-phosphate isomerase-like protein (cupin superfamily)
MDRDVVAPDGSDVRVLLRFEHGEANGSMAHFELAPSMVSKATTHKTVSEIWYVIAGRGQMWRRWGEQTQTVDLYAGVCLTIPQGTHFQFRALGYEPLSAIGVTLPAWPNTDDEAIFVDGEWTSTVV